MAGGESYGGITVPKGDPGALEASAGRLVATAGLLQSVSGHLNGVLGALSWFGPASAQHSLLTGTQNLMATTSSTALIQQASVINGYAEVLQAAQRQAERAIERAKDADERIKQAKEDIRQAIDDQGAAQARIVAAQIAQSRVFTSAVDLLAGNSAAAAAVDLAAAEEADARKDLEAAQERERQARRRLEEAEEDRREAQQDGLDAEEAVNIARVSLIAAAQGAGLLPTQPGGPANPAFAAAAGITLPKPPEPKEDDRNWFERRLDDVGNAASWTWDQAQQVPGGVWEGTKGIYEGGKFVMELNPTNPMNWRDPGAMIDRYQQLGQAGKFAWENPGEFGKALINYEDLAAGRYGEWAGNLLPDAVLAVATGGAGTAASRSAQMAKASSKLADASRAYNRAVDIKGRMPTVEYRVDKTFSAQAGDQGKVSISGEIFDDHRRMMERVGEDPSLLKTQTSEQMRDGMQRAADHTMPGHWLDKRHGQPSGWYYGTHAELRLLLDEPKVPVGVSKAPCPPNCDPGIQNLAASLKEDIVVQSAPDRATLYRADGQVFRNARPEDFSGVNSKWPGILWGAGGAGAGAAAGP
jgi:type VII secretion system ESX-1 substrate